MNRAEFDAAMDAYGEVYARVWVAAEKWKAFPCGYRRSNTRLLGFERDEDRLDITMEDDERDTERFQVDIDLLLGDDYQEGLVAHFKKLQDHYKQEVADAEAKRASALTAATRERDMRDLERLKALYPEQFKETP